MAQFDVYRNPDAVGYLIDCQADTLSDYSTRLVVPLQPPDIAPKPAGRLNPVFEIAGAPFVTVTQFAAAVPLRDMKATGVSLDAHQYDVFGALDMLITGV